MPSLLEALEQKYGMGCDIDNQESLVSIFIPKLPPRLTVPELLVLNDCDIDKAGEPDVLQEKCCSVKELDLAQNKLQNWNEVFTILSHMPRVEFVNLSLNRLSGPVDVPSPLIDNAGMSRIRNLVLNNTRLCWESVETIIKLIPTLEELHLSLNDYRNVLIDTIDDVDTLSDDFDMEIGDDDDCTCSTSTDEPHQIPTMTKRSDSTSSTYKKTDAHEGVKKLHFTGNPVSEWSEICRLGRVFPKLEALVLAECPLRAIEAAPKSPPIIISDGAGSSSSTSSSSTFTTTTTINDANSEDSPHHCFKNLALLNLSNTQINTWEDIDRLAKFPSLRNLRVQNWPLWEKCDSTEHERRQLLIARLPFVQTLNGGGIITTEEREDAERAFIRYYMNREEEERPARYAELIEIHGKLDPLVCIDLRPEKRVKIKFTYGDSFCELRSVDVYRTVNDLKTRLEPLINLPAGKMRLFYAHQDLGDQQGGEEMKFPHKQLYSYNIRTGDEIIIVDKILNNVEKEKKKN